MSTVIDLVFICVGFFVLLFAVTWSLALAYGFLIALPMELFKMLGESFRWYGLRGILQILGLFVVWAFMAFALVYGIWEKFAS